MSPEKEADCQVQILSFLIGFLILETLDPILRLHLHLSLQLPYTLQ